MGDDDPKREWILRDGFAASCEIDPAAGSFDFVTGSGRHEVHSVPDTCPGQVAQLIADIPICVPVSIQRSS